MVTFAALARVNQIRFLSDNGPSYTPRDYSVGLILPDGSAKEIASIAGEHSVGGTWQQFPVSGSKPRAFILRFALPATADIRQPLPSFRPTGNFLPIPNLQLIPHDVVIPIGGYAGKQLHFIGNVGSGFPVTPDVETTVGGLCHPLRQRAKRKRPL